MSIWTPRLVLEVVTAFVAGAAAASAIFTWLIFADPALLTLALVIVAASLVIALVVEASNPQLGGLASMVAGVITLLVGVVELAFVGLTYQVDPYPGQPAWVEELSYIVAGIVIVALGLRVWRPRAASAPAATARPV